MTKAIVALAALAITASGVFYSCKKESTATPETTTQQTSVKRTGGSGGFNSMEHYSGKFRYYPNKAKDCIDKDGNCHPEDIIINGTQQATLDNAIANGSMYVSELFANNEAAVAYIPEWNTAWFADAKTAILSGNYTFAKVQGAPIYLLGRVGVVNSENYDYVLSFKIQ